MTSARALAATVLVLAISGCATPVSENSLEHTEAAPSAPFGLALDFSLFDDQDAIVSLDINGTESTMIRVLFDDITPLAGRDAWSWSFYALTHGEGSLWMSRTWYSLGSVAVSAGGNTLDAGPAWDPLVNEVLRGEDYSSNGWTVQIPPNHYHAVLAVEGATAQARLEIPDVRVSTAYASVEATQVDAANVLSSFHPEDFDEVTQVQTPAAAAIDLRHDFSISHPLNQVVFFAGGPYQWELTGNGVECGFDYYARYQTAGIEDLPVGRYTLDATGAGDLPWLFLNMVEIPGHDDVDRPLGSQHCT